MGVQVAGNAEKKNNKGSFFLIIAGCCCSQSIAFVIRPRLKCRSNGYERIVE